MISTLGKASILAVGTEITTGQITNRNAAWISEKLTELGIEVVIHEAVADDKTQIFTALEHCAGLSQLIFVTGGLGPTTDDFTREVVSDWLKQPLEFDESSWNRIVERLTGFGIKVAESNRQQCYFPKNSEIIRNPEGTASAFTASVKDSKQIWVLPGPPNEIRAIWDQGIELMIQKICPKAAPLTLMTWQCIGKSEAELGEITERALQGSGLQTGYRAHRPFVEVKVWFTQQQLESKKDWIQKLENAISPWVITKQGQDLAEKLLQHLCRSENVEIIDGVSGGLIAERLGPFLRDPKFQEQAGSITLVSEWAPIPYPAAWVSEVLSNADETALTLVLGGFSSEFEVAVGLREGSQIFQETIASPYKKPELIVRTRYFTLEMALKKWCDWLAQSTH